MDIDSTYFRKALEGNNYLSDIDPEKNYSENVTSGFDSFFDFLHSPIMRAIGFIAIAIFLIFIVMKFYRYISDARQDAEVEKNGMGDDTIYGHEWDKEIQEVLSAKEYEQLVVLCYLRHLHSLHQQEIIAFEQHKTPGMLLAEAEKYCHDNDDKALLDKTSTLTMHYLRIRYGHRKASDQLAQQLLNL